ncbi:MAG: uroporphyrinogen decarboxylase family protein [Dehalococcoidales bacterium]
MNKTSGELYNERLKRIEDAIRLKKPDSVPILVEFGYFIARYSGVTYRDIIYDRAKCVTAYQKTVTELEPDVFHCIPFDSGVAMETIDTRIVKWPGRGLAPNQSHQYVEGEYMMADEYDSFLENPTDFILRTYLPRTCGALGSFREFPGQLNLLSIARGRMTPLFAEPEFITAFQAIYQASQAAAEWNAAWKRFIKDIEDKGYPAITLVGGQAPFDFFSDHLRGMKGIMLDMYRQPDKLLAAMDRVLPILIRKIKTLTRVSGNNLVFMGPHRGSEGFMSLKQFEKFYWPGLKATILAVIESGFTPYVLWEGDYTSRLKYLLELPAGKILCRFDRTDIFKASQVLGGHHCIAGGMSPSLLQVGSVQQVKDHCKRLIETIGRDGGYVMGHSVVLDEARIENVRAMVDATREYGVYR